MECRPRLSKVDYASALRTATNVLQIFLISTRVIGASPFPLERVLPFQVELLNPAFKFLNILFALTGVIMKMKSEHVKEF